MPVGPGGKIKGVPLEGTPLGDQFPAVSIELDEVLIQVADAAASNFD